MATFPDAYTKADLKSDLLSLARRENDTTYEARLERFIWQARAHLLRKFALMGLSDFEADFEATLADGDTSVAEPTGFSRWYTLWLEDTTGAFQTQLNEVPYSVYRRLLTGEELSSASGGMYVIKDSLIDNTPGVYARWNGTIYLFPEVDRDDLVIKGGYYYIPAANVADQDDTFGADDPLFGMHDLLYEACAWKAEEWLRDPESANRHYVNMERAFVTHVKLLRMERDVPAGDYPYDSVEDR